eukprot:m.126876 g.126876  ORF g.126876 m.126876 type:complete len:1422 (+) comp15786_c0_seq1:74-4339(+)
MKEDITDWINRILDREIEPELLIEELKTGVLLVQLARYIESNGQQGEEVDLSKVKNVHKSRSLWPQLRRRVGDGTAKLPCHSNVAVPFFALDNVDTFVKWCRKLGLREELLFESTNVAEGSPEIKILNVLMSVAHLAAYVGLESTELVMMGLEVDANFDDDVSVAMESETELETEPEDDVAHEPKPETDPEPVLPLSLQDISVTLVKAQAMDLPLSQPVDFDARALTDVTVVDDHIHINLGKAFGLASITVRSDPEDRSAVHSFKLYGRLRPDQSWQGMEHEDASQTRHTAFVNVEVVEERTYALPKQAADEFYHYLRLEPLQTARSLSLTMLLHVYGSCALVSQSRTDDGTAPLATLTTSSDPSDTAAYAWLDAQTATTHWVPAETDESPTLRLAFPRPVQLKTLLFKSGLQASHQALAVVVSARIRDPDTGKFAWQRIQLRRATSLGSHLEETDDVDPDAPPDLLVYFGEEDVDQVIHLRNLATEPITDLKIAAVDWQGQPSMALDALVHANVALEPKPEVEDNAVTPPPPPPPVDESVLADDLARAQELLTLLEQHTVKASHLHESVLACLPVANDMADGPVALLVREVQKLQEGAEPQAEQLVDMLKTSKGKQLEDAKRGADRFAKDCNSAMSLLRSKTQELLKFVEELTEQHASLAVTGQDMCDPDVVVREEDARDLMVSLQQLNTSSSKDLADRLLAVIEKRNALLPQLQAISDMLQVNTTTLATRSDQAVDTINASLAAIRALLATLDRADEEVHPSLLRKRSKRSSKRLSQAELDDLANQADRFKARQRRLNQFKLPFYGKLDWSYVKARVDTGAPAGWRPKRASTFSLTDHGSFDSSRVSSKINSGLTRRESNALLRRRSSTIEAVNIARAHAATSQRKQVDPLDKLVKQAVRECSDPSAAEYTSLGKGKFHFAGADKAVAVRQVRKRLMARVGGGWETFSLWLDKHLQRLADNPGRNSVSPSRKSTSPRKSTLRNVTAASAPALMDAPTADVADGDSDDSTVAKAPLPTRAASVPSQLHPSEPKEAQAEELRDEQVEEPSPTNTSKAEPTAQDAEPPLEPSASLTAASPSTIETVAQAPVVHDADLPSITTTSVKRAPPIPKRNSKGHVAPAVAPRPKRPSASKSADTRTLTPSENVAAESSPDVTEQDTQPAANEAPLEPEILRDADPSATKPSKDSPSKVASTASSTINGIAVADPTPAADRSSSSPTTSSPPAATVVRRNSIDSNSNSPPRKAAATLARKARAQSARPASKTAKSRSSKALDKPTTTTTSKPTSKSRAASRAPAKSATLPRKMATNGSTARPKSAGTSRPSSRPKSSAAAPQRSTTRTTTTTTRRPTRASPTTKRKASTTTAGSTSSLPRSSKGGKSTTGSSSAGSKPRRAATIQPRQTNASRLRAQKVAAGGSSNKQ